MSMENIRYLLIGSPETKEEIGSFPEKGVPKKIKTDSFQIFQKFCSTTKMKDLRNKINNNNDGNYFFTINSEDIFYLILADDNLKESEIFGLIDFIQKENIPLLVDTTTRKLNLVGRQNLKKAIQSYFENNNSMNKLNDINVELAETKKLMTNGINNMTNNIAKVEVLDEKSNQIKQNAIEFNRGAVALKKYAWWSNCKWTIILILIIILLLIIILPISISVGKKKNDKNKEENNNNNNTISNNNNGNINTKRRLRILYSENEYFSY